MRTSLKLLTVLGLNTPIGARILATQPSHLIGYWPLGETTGTTADDVSSTNADGTYSGTFTLNQDGIGDGSRSVLLDGTSGRVSLATPLAALSAVFSGAAGSIVIYGRVTNSAVWTDGLDHTLISIGADASNRFYIGKQSINNALSMFGSFGGVTAGIFPTGQSWTEIRSLGITWDKAQNEFKAYLSGIQTGTTQTITGTYAGALSASWTAIGSLTSGAGTIPWAGYGAHAGVWKVALTPAEMLRVGAV